MIPNDTWISLDAPASSFLRVIRTAPPLPREDPIEIVMTGPESISGQSDLLQDFYLLTVSSNGTFRIRRRRNSGWGTPQELFTTNLVVVQAVFDFDQTRFPIVFFRTISNQVYGWFTDIDGVRREQLLINSSTSISCSFDYPREPENPNSDVLLFYVRSDNELMMLRQRDRYQTDFIVGVNEEDLSIIRSGVNISNRMQISYRSSQDG